MKWTYQTRKGVYTIQWRDGRFHGLAEGVSLCNYDTPWQVAEDLAGGHCDSPPSGVDPSTLGIPSDPAEWERHG